MSKRFTIFILLTFSLSALALRPHKGNAPSGILPGHHPDAVSSTNKLTKTPLEITLDANNKILNVTIPGVRLGSRELRKIKSAIQKRMTVTNGVVNLPNIGVIKAIIDHNITAEFPPGLDIKLKVNNISSMGGGAVEGHRRDRSWQFSATLKIIMVSVFQSL